MSLICNSFHSASSLELLPLLQYISIAGTRLVSFLRHLFSRERYPMGSEVSFNDKLVETDSGLLFLSIGDRIIFHHVMIVIWTTDSATCGDCYLNDWLYHLWWLLFERLALPLVMIVIWTTDCHLLWLLFERLTLPLVMIVIWMTVSTTCDDCFLNNWLYHLWWLLFERLALPLVTI